MSLLEEDVAGLAMRLHAQAGRDETLGCGDAVAGGRTSILEGVGQELTSLLINVLDRHKLLMEDDLLVAVGSWHAANATDILQDHQTEGHILPEEASLQVQHNLAGVSRISWHHGEGHTAVAEVGVENALEAGLVSDLSLVHGANALSNGQHLGQLQFGEPAHQALLDRLDLIVKELDLSGRRIIQILVELGHLASLEGRFTVPVLEEAVDTTWVNDLVRRAQGHVQETGNRNRGDEIAVGERVASVVHSVEGVARQVQMLLGTDDVHILTVVDGFANERHIL